MVENKMKWEQIPLGPLQTNCYLLYKDNGECIIFDPGGEGRKLIKLIENRHLKPLAIMLTHAHFDHIGAVDEIRSYWSVPVYLHKNEEKWLCDPALNGSMAFNFVDQITAKDADVLIESEKIIEIEQFNLNVFETPGHSPGSVSYYIEEAGVVFSGDALFYGSIGRTDLHGGDHEQLLKSIHDKLLSLPEQTVVASGHGPETTIIQEMDQNPFLNGF
jgi:hydroxyacylglutathione hydrolase